MAKGYWIVNNHITDTESYERYKAANAAPIQRHGGRFVVRAGQQEIREGDGLPRCVVIEFPSYEAARAAYDDPEYQAAADIRKDAASGLFLIVEGYDG